VKQRYITMRPKLDASKDLKKIVSRLTQTTEKNFITKLDEWYEIYKDFLDEKSISSTTGNIHYTHPRIRAAYRSLSILSHEKYAPVFLIKSFITIPTN